MMTRKKSISSDRFTEVSIVASVVQLSFLILTVVYSNEPPDFWDLVIAGFVIWFGIKYRRDLRGNTIARLLAVAGVAISFMTVVFFVLTYWQYAVLNTVYIRVESWISATLNIPEIVSKAELVSSTTELLVSVAFYILLYFTPLWRARIER